MADAAAESSLFPEGFAMLNAVVEDFRGVGEEIVTTLDARLTPIQNYIRAHKIIEIAGGEFEEKFEANLAESDAVLLIAPEFDNILFELARKVERAGKLLLGPSADAIKITADKAETHKKALEAHVLVPSAIRVAFSEKSELIDKICRQIGYPVVFKPIDGVGGSGICIIASQQDIEAGLQTVRKETRLETFQVQKFINGLDVSISAIVSEKEVRPISLNAQLVRLGPPTGESEYRGGYLPISHALKDEAFENSKKILQHLEGFRGYVGLDFVFSYAPFLIEINPRITTSYLGLREVLSINPAQIILDAVQGKPSKKVSLNGATIFTKETFEGEWNHLEVPTAFQGRIKISTPPFPVQGHTITLLVARAESIKLAQETLTNFINYIKKQKERANI
ncbi:MAG: ATP-grasp domain-containing protein [Candidatus Helarchaeota archaeon]|nr:ATP-grasp domain-containing protein [Candidatus Helarchaeota archaeon]